MMDDFMEEVRHQAPPKGSSFSLPSGVEFRPEAIYSPQVSNSQFSTGHADAEILQKVAQLIRIDDLRDDIDLKQHPEWLELESTTKSSALQKAHREIVELRKAFHTLLGIHNSVVESLSNILDEYELAKPNHPIGNEEALFVPISNTSRDDSTTTIARSKRKTSVDKNQSRVDKKIRFTDSIDTTATAIPPNQSPNTMSTWECSMCTYVNDLLIHPIQCAMCSMKRVSTG